MRGEGIGKREQEWRREGAEEEIMKGHTSDEHM